MLPGIRALVVLSTPDVAADLGADPRIRGVAVDSVVRVAAAPAAAAAMTKHLRTFRARPDVPGGDQQPLRSVTPDPAFTLSGLMWNYGRIGLPSGWSSTLGQGWVTVGMVGTGIDSTHIEMATKVAGVRDFTGNEDPNLCQSRGLPTDQQLATAFGAPSDTLDFHGLGTWLAGEIAGRLDGAGINGIAPKVLVYSLKVAQNCGLAYDSTIISAILFAGQQGINVIDVPFAQFLNRKNHAQNLVYQAYAAAVKRATSEGTTVVAAAGDQHTQIGAGGLVTSHGVLSAPPGGIDDYGLYEVPGGVPGVIDVSSVARFVTGTSSTCPSDSLAAGTHQWCKPSADAHHPLGVGRINQLAFYSNYGPRISIAAPGGSRKFNLPPWDRGGTEGWPWTGASSVEGGTSTSEGHNAWMDYSITSDFATQVPCFTFTSDPVFPNSQCYAILSGTAMASANVAGVLALLLSAHPALMGNPAGLKKLLFASVMAGHNTTPPVSRNDMRPGDTGGPRCSSRWCHLGGSPISNAWAYGAGIVRIK